MIIKSFFSKLKTCLQNTEMFERPIKKLPGRWELYEYFVEVEDELLHFNKADLLQRKDTFVLDISEDGKYQSEATIGIKVVKKLKCGEWDVAKNFITFLVSDNFRDNPEFQFAFEKGNLKLLKKDSFGKIEFFGFLKKIVEK